MRMWGAKPETMCRQHLLGEHLEMHMFVGSMKKHVNLKGYVKKDLVEPQNIKQRHDVLVAEMKKRGYNHDSPLDQPDTDYLRKNWQTHNFDKVVSASELYTRCEDCRKRAANDWYKKHEEDDNHDTT